MRITIHRPRSGLRPVAGFAAVIMCLLATGVAAADFDTNNRRCVGLEEGAGPDMRIGACTWLLQSGRVLEEELAQVYYDRGVAYDEKGDYDAAIGDFTQAINLRPDIFLGYHLRGMAHIDKGDFNSAVADFTQAIRRAPDYGPAYEKRGWAYFELEKVDETWQDAEKACDLGQCDLLEMLEFFGF